MTAAFVGTIGMFGIVSAGAGATLTLAVLTACAVASILTLTLSRGAERRPDLGEPEEQSGCASLDLVDVIERLSRDVRSGRSLRDALTDSLRAAPTVLPEVADRLHRHAVLIDAIESHRPCHDERDLLAHALRLGAEHTHVLPDVLDRTATMVRERRAWRSERVAQAAQARASARVLTVLPIVFAAWGVASSSAVRDAYATSPVTAFVAAFGIGLNVAGWWWMRRVVRT